MPTIAQLDAFEILDSRGKPTLEVECRLVTGAKASAQVPSGASTGAAEARECRDGDPRRHAGMGCLQAAANVTGPIRERLAGGEFNDQSSLDSALLELDGTRDRSKLGANAILGTSIAFARAHAIERGIPLYQHFADLLAEPAIAIPRPTVNLFSGGKHAGNQVAIQDVLIVPVKATDMSEALVQVSAVYRAAIDLIDSRYSARALVADEGGLAPPFESAEAMLRDAVEAIEMAGLTPGDDMALAVDVAASHFYQGHFYRLDGESLSSLAMVERLGDWVKRYPIVSVEDGLAEEDWEHWPRLNQRLSGVASVMGDDLLCTQPDRIRRAIAEEAATALLLKVNQVGTLTEAAEACRVARSGGWQITVSARSGETEDDWLADLAAGWRGDYVKIGSITRSERLAKYNRLLAIQRESAAGWAGEIRV